VDSSPTQNIIISIIIIIIITTVIIIKFELSAR